MLVAGAAARAEREAQVERWVKMLAEGIYRAERRWRGGRESSRAAVTQALRMNGSPAEERHRARKNRSCSPRPGGGHDWGPMNRETEREDYSLDRVGPLAHHLVRKVCKSMNKSRITISLAPDVLAVVQRAASAENVSVSAMTENALRLYCADYAPHRIDISFLEKGRVSVVVERSGRSFFCWRTVPRLQMGGGVQAVVVLSVQGPLRAGPLADALGSFIVPAVVKGGVPPSLSKDGIEVVLKDFTTGNARQDVLQQFLSRATQTVRDLGVLSVRQVSKYRCPECRGLMSSKTVWEPTDDGVEVEWVCALGHRTRGAVPPPLE